MQIHTNFSKNRSRFNVHSTCWYRWYVALPSQRAKNAKQRSFFKKILPDAATATPASASSYPPALIQFRYVALHPQAQGRRNCRTLVVTGGSGCCRFSWYVGSRAITAPGTSTEEGQSRSRVRSVIFLEFGHVPVLSSIERSLQTPWMTLNLPHVVPE